MRADSIERNTLLAAVKEAHAYVEERDRRLARLIITELGEALRQGPPPLMAAEDVITRLRVEGRARSRAMHRRRAGDQGTVGTSRRPPARSRACPPAGFSRPPPPPARCYKGYGFLKGAVNTTVNLAKSTAAFSRASGLDQKAVAGVGRRRPAAQH